MEPNELSALEIRQYTQTIHEAQLINATIIEQRLKDRFVGIAFHANHLWGFLSKAAYPQLQGQEVLLLQGLAPEAKFLTAVRNSRLYQYYHEPHKIIYGAFVLDHNWDYIGFGIAKDQVVTYYDKFGTQHREKYIGEYILHAFNIAILPQTPTILDPTHINTLRIGEDFINTPNIRSQIKNLSSYYQAYYWQIFDAEVPNVRAALVRHVKPTDAYWESFLLNHTKFEHLDIVDGNFIEKEYVKGVYFFNKDYLGMGSVDLKKGKANYIDLNGKFVKLRRNIVKYYPIFNIAHIIS